MMSTQARKSTGEIITFYSYKGGTGRTMSLANIACLISSALKENEKVLVIDWDLEAPGLHHYLRRYISYEKYGYKNQGQAISEHKGLIELFVQLRKKIADEKAELGDQEHLDELVAGIQFEEFVLSTEIKGLHFLKAGRFDGDYSERVNQFDWVNFFHSAPLLFQALSDSWSNSYRYILIDSRTGVADSSGICTALMPDKLVAVFTPNRQSLTGVLSVVNKAAKYRLQSDDLRPLSVFPLPSRLETSEKRLKEVWRYGSKVSDSFTDDFSDSIVGYQKCFEQLFESIYSLSECSLDDYFDDVQIQHFPRYSYGEELCVTLDELDDRLSLAQSYRVFADILLDGDSKSSWDYQHLTSSLTHHIAGTLPSVQNRPEIVKAPTPLRVFEEPLKLDILTENIRKLLIPGGVTAGVAGAYWSLFGAGESDWGKAIASVGLGFALSIGSLILGPLTTSIRRRANHVGEVIDNVTEQVIASATGFDGKYLRCQASACESVRSEGVRQGEGIFEPMLKEVFVELQIDSSASFAGFETQLQSAARPGDLASINGQNSQSIWDLLAASRGQKAFRQMAILAWGGYGKTTLLKHVCYCYGTGNAPQQMNGQKVPNLLPVLLVLRKYRKQIVQASPPSLPELISQHHIPSLPESNRLQPIPLNWAKDTLQRGKALIMFDGFDEVPLSERPAVAKWIDEQMRQYAKSVFVVTSKPKAYKEQDAADRLALSMPMWVQPFDKEQRQRFVENWYLCQEQLRTRRDTPEVRKVAADSAGELLAQIEAEEELRKMAKNPLMLNMIATFHRQNSMAPLPKRRSELYGEICTLQLKDRPRARGLETVLLDMESQLVLGKVALGMMQKALKRIDREELLGEIRRALKEQDESVEAEDFLNDVVLISEIVVRQEEEYEFAHLSFQEYLAAAYLAADAEAREPLLFEHLTKDWWKATILMYVGKTKQPASLIREALRQGANGLAYDCYKQTREQLDESLRTELEEL